MDHSKIKIPSHQHRKLPMSRKYDCMTVLLPQWEFLDWSCSIFMFFGFASVVVTFGSLWCHSHYLKLGINSFIHHYFLVDPCHILLGCFTVTKAIICPYVNEVTLKDMGQTHQNPTTTKHNKAQTMSRARFLSLAWSKLRLCLANHRAGYFSNLACDWLSIVWAYSEQETENRPIIHEMRYTSMHSQCVTPS